MIWVKKLNLGNAVKVELDFVREFKVFRTQDNPLDVRHILSYYFQFKTAGRG